MLYIVACCDNFQTIASSFKHLLYFHIYDINHNMNTFPHEHYNTGQTELEGPAVEAFVDTPEFGQIEYHRGIISAVREEIDVAVGGAMTGKAIISAPSAEEKLAWAAGDTEKLAALKAAKVEQADRYLYDNGIAVNISTIVDASEDNHLSPNDPVIKGAYDTLKVCDDRLQGLVDALPSLPHLRMNEQVRVRRNPNHEHPDYYYEPDWTVGVIQGNGLIGVQKADGTARKAVDLDSLVAWNSVEQPPAEQ